MNVRHVCLLVTLICAVGCAPRVDKLEIRSLTFSGNCANLPDRAAGERSDNAVCVQISPMKTTVGEPTVVLQSATYPRTPGPGGAQTGVPPSTTVTLRTDGSPTNVGQPPTPSQPYKACGTTNGAPDSLCDHPVGLPAMNYGSAWTMTLNVPYNSLGTHTLTQTRNFVVGAPTTCSAFDHGLAGWNLVNGGFGVGSFSNTTAWDVPPRGDNNNVPASLDIDNGQNFPDVFVSTDPLVKPGALVFTIGNFSAQSGQSWILDLASGNDWLWFVPNQPTVNITVQVKTDAEIQMRARTRCRATVAPGNVQECNPPYQESRTFDVPRGAGWQSVTMPLTLTPPPGNVSTQVFQADILVHGHLGDAGKKVWIDMVCRN